MPKRTQKAKPVLFTIGYEQATPDALIGELKRAKVKLLVDVRAVAASRKPGFSKRQLAATLDENGIGYLHLQKLGTPRRGPHRRPRRRHEDDAEDLRKATEDAGSERSDGGIAVHCAERHARLPAVLRARCRRIATASASPKSCMSGPAPQSTISRRRFSASFQKTPIALRGTQLPRLRATALNWTRNQDELERLLRRYVWAISPPSSSF